MKSLPKILSLVFTVLFVLAAYVQWNDPDATIWYFIYGIAALASLLFFMGRLRFILALLLFVLYVIGTIGLWPEQWEGVSIGGGNIENIERAREALGLLLTGFIMLFYALYIRSSGRTS